MADTKPYRPSNGTEGDIFVRQWCEHCNCMAPHDDGCPILNAAMVFKLGDQQYPPEWIYRGTVPTCTAFQHKLGEASNEPTIRCDKTPDMFEETRHE